MLENKKILFIGAHYDDLELGCGGTMLKYQKSSEIHYLIVTDSEIKRNKKIIRSKDSIKKDISKIKKKLNLTSLRNLNFKCNTLQFNEKLIIKILDNIETIGPDVIFTHWPEDIHQDHSAIGKATMSAGRRIKNILFYQSNFYDSLHKFKENFYINITKEFSEKIDLIKIFKNELKRNSNSWIDQVERSNSSYGYKIQTKYAEAFQILRLANY